MEIKMQVKNFDSAIRAFKNLQESSQKPMTDILKGGGQEIRNIAVKKIQSDPKSGRTYMKYNPTRQHKASAPGEAPATDTGYLVSQIKVKAVKPDEVVVDSQAPYSAYLELGTAKIQPRPFMFPATEIGGKKIALAIFNYVKDFIKRAERK